MELHQDTYKDTKIGRIPKDWNLIKLSELGKFYRGHTYSAINVQSNGLLVLRSTNIQKRTLILHKDLVFVDKDCKEDILLRNGDLVICMANGSKRLVGKSAKYFGEDRKDTTIGAFCSIYRSKNALVNYLFETYYYKKYLQITLAGSTINNLKNSELEKFTFPFPNDIKEQQKIADILSTVDEQISTTDKIIEKSKELRKGLMQKLFSEGIGHTKFKDTKIGRIPKDWEVVKLNDISKKTNQGVNTTTEKVKYSAEGKYQVIRSNNLSDNYIDWNNSVFIDDNTFDRISENVKPNYNDILYSNIGSALGYAAVVTETIDFAIAWNVFRIQTLSSEINSSFLAYFLNFRRKHIRRLETQSTMPFISSKVMLKVQVALPYIIEQQKIADILSEADAKIEKEQTQKTQLETLKKGLMQQLLTGKKRVNV